MSQQSSHHQQPAAAQPSQPPLPSRRRFLKSTAGLMLAAGVSLPAMQWLAGCAPVRDPRPWDELAANLRGGLLRPGDPGHVQRARPWALEYARILPQGIAQCADEEDVRTCLQWAQANNVPLVARSGGHSYAGYSTTTGLMIDVSAMNTVAFDPDSGQATVGGGARNKDVYAACAPLERAITHGRCLGVGAAGLVLGGGIGFNMRLHGLTCDQLVETRVVLADGSVLVCNETENADLFWACRGAGGGNFGIHTSFTFDTFPVGNLTVFNITWAERLPDLFAAVLAMIETAPNTLGLKMSINAVKQAGASVMTLNLLGQLAGTRPELDALLAPIMAVQSPAAAIIEEGPYWEVQPVLSEEGAPQYSHERSRFVPGNLSGAAMETIFVNLEEWPGTGSVTDWKFFLLGGAVDAHQPDDMAFVHRGHTMLSSIELAWLASDSAEVVAENVRWLADFHAEMEQYTSPYCYQNFIDPNQENYLEAYYGANLPRLQEVKRAYDPGNLFHYPQSIPV